MGEVCRAVEEVESNQDSLQSDPYDWLGEDMVRHHVLEGSQTQAKRRKNENVMRAIWSLHLERILEHSNHLTTRVI